jgi:hypothetical protein
VLLFVFVELGRLGTGRVDGATEFWPSLSRVESRSVIIRSFVPIKSSS